MSIEFIYPEFEIIRNLSRCNACRACERQCSNAVHSFDAENGVMTVSYTHLWEIISNQKILQKQYGILRQKAMPMTISNAL